ncbi:hypothetical protein KEM54_004287, partial [Ascosphaera aggregata]
MARNLDDELRTFRAVYAGVVSMLPSTPTSVGDAITQCSPAALKFILSQTVIIMRALATDCSRRNAFVAKFEKAVGTDSIGRDTAADLVEAMLHTDNPHRLDEKLFGASPRVAQPSPMIADATSIATDAFSLSERRREGIPSVSEAVSRILTSFNNAYASGRYVSPYTSIIGPSGIGKSAAVRNLASNGYHYVFYVSLASSASTAYPPRSPLADEIVNWDMDMALLEPALRRQLFVAKWLQVLTALVVDISACRRLGISPA